MLFNSIAVFIAGGCGCVIRYLFNSIYANFIGSNLFFATLFANTLGSFILGGAVIFFEKFSAYPALKYAIIVGFCGGLTTFSTFSLETFTMIEKGQIIPALFYILASFSLCICFIFIGMSAAKIVLN